MWRKYVVNYRKVWQIIEKKILAFKAHLLKYSRICFPTSLIHACDTGLHSYSHLFTQALVSGSPCIAHTQGKHPDQALPLKLSKFLANQGTFIRQNCAFFFTPSGKYSTSKITTPEHWTKLKHNSRTFASNWTLTKWKSKMLSISQGAPFSLEK